jgi:hypothetical protein
LNWKVNGDGTQKWSNDICVSKKVTTTYVTCGCSSLGEIAASVAIAGNLNPNPNTNTNPNQNTN